MTPDELKRPDADGVPVEMADGAEWLVRRPRALWMPDDNEAGYSVASDLGPEWDALVAEGEKDMTNGQAFGLYFRMFSFLLRLNYTLDNAALKTILRVDFGPILRDGDPEPRNDGERRFCELRDVALGRDPSPKPSPAGHD